MKSKVFKDLLKYWKSETFHSTYTQSFSRQGAIIHYLLLLSAPNKVQIQERSYYCPLTKNKLEPPEFHLTLSRPMTEKSVIQRLPQEAGKIRVFGQFSMDNSSGVNNFIGLILFSEVRVYSPLNIKNKKSCHSHFHHAEIAI